MTHYLQGDFGITDDEAPNKETSMIRRGLDAIFVAGVLRPCMDKDHMFPALGQPYFKEIEEQSLPLAASVYEGAQSQTYMNMAKNVNEVTDTLARAGHHLFNDPA